MEQVYMANLEKKVQNVLHFQNFEIANLYQK